MVFDTLNNGESWLTHRNKLNDNFSKAVEKVAGKELSDNNFSDTDKSKLDWIADWATANSSDAVLLNRANHTGTQTADTITQGITNDVVTIWEKKHMLRNASSWLIEGWVVTANATNPNNVDISAWKWVVVDNSDPDNPVLTEVSWTAQTDVVLTNIATQPITNLYFDKNGVLQQWTLTGINSTRRQNILVGIAFHIFWPTLENVSNITAMPYDTYIWLDELTATLWRIKSNIFSTSWLNINLSAWTVFGIWDNKSDPQNPNFTSFTAQSNVSWRTTYRDGAGGWAYGWPTSSINNTQYDDWSWTLQTLANNKATVHLLFWNSLTNDFFLQIGQNEYSNWDEAKSSYLSDSQETNPLLSWAIFLGVIGMVKNSTNTFFIQNSDKLGQLGIGWGSGSAATDLQSSYNVSLPAAEIETNTTNWALSLKGGTGTDTDDVLEIKNNSGTITASVQANGTPTKGTDLITKTYADANYLGSGTDPDAIHDNVAWEINAIAEKVSPSWADLIIIEDSADANNKKKVQIGNLPTGWGWEANTASNVWVGGVGIFKQKTGVNLEFKNVNAGSNKVNVSDDGVNNEIDIDIVEANIVHQNLSGAWTNTHAQIDSHIASTANPHGVTKSQVGLWAVDNTSDADKPVSTATQTALDWKLDSVVAWTNVTIDNTDPNNPIINASGWGGWGWLRETIQIAGTQLVNTILYEGAIGKATTLDAGYLTLLTAPTWSSFIITVSKSTDSWATYPTSETVTLTATNKYVKGALTTAFVEGDFLKIEVTQVGSTVAGQNLTFTVTGS